MKRTQLLSTKPAPSMDNMLMAPSANNSRYPAMTSQTASAARFQGLACDETEPLKIQPRHAPPPPPRVQVHPPQYASFAKVPTLQDPLNRPPSQTHYHPLPQRNLHLQPNPLMMDQRSAARPPVQARMSMQQETGSPFQSYLQYHLQQEEMQHQQSVHQYRQKQLQEYQAQQLKEYQMQQQLKEYQMNHPINLNNYIVKVIVGPKEIRVLETNCNTPLPKNETATISSTGSTSLLIQQLTDRLKTSGTMATGDCLPCIENISTYLRTVQYHLRNKAELRFWPYFANASSSGSISCAFVEQSQDARPLVNSTNKTRVNPTQFWYEARKACESVDWPPEDVHALLYMSVSGVSAAGLQQQGGPLEILVIVHEGPAGKKPVPEIPSIDSAPCARAVQTSRNRVSQNLDKELQEYLETEKRLTSPGVVNATMISNLDYNPQSLISEDDLYDQELQEFESYLRIPPPVPEKDQRFLSTDMSKPRSLRCEASLQSNLFRLEELPAFTLENCIRSSTNNNTISNNSDSSLSYRGSNETTTTKLTDSLERVCEPDLTATRAETPKVTAKPPPTQSKPDKTPLPKPAAPKSKSSRRPFLFKSWLASLFSSRSGVPKKKASPAPRPVKETTLRRALSLMPSCEFGCGNGSGSRGGGPTSDKYLLTNLDVIYGGLSASLASGGCSLSSAPPKGSTESTGTEKDQDKNKTKTGQPRPASAPAAVDTAQPCDDAVSRLSADCALGLGIDSFAAAAVDTSPLQLLSEPKPLAAGVPSVPPRAVRRNSPETPVLVAGTCTAEPAAPALRRAIIPSFYDSVYAAGPVATKNTSTPSAAFGAGAGAGGRKPVDSAISLLSSRVGSSVYSLAVIPPFDEDDARW